MFLFEKCAGTVTTYSSQQYYSNPDITNSWEAMISEATGTLIQQIMT